MKNEEQTGYEGPYPAPVPIPGGTVRGEWIDYNGHMNVMYYTHVFDRAIDDLLEDVLGIGESFARDHRMGPYALQSHAHFLGELREGDTYSFRVVMIDSDAKRMHLALELLDDDGGVAATCEQLLINVDLKSRKSAPYPDWAQDRIRRMTQDHADAPRPEQIGQPLGIRRRV